jgi:hypothetical protein
MMSPAVRTLGILNIDFSAAEDEIDGGNEA